MVIDNKIIEPHPNVEPIIDPREINLDTIIMGTPMMPAIIPVIGDKINKLPHPVAIPLPPLNFAKMGQQCPTYAPKAEIPSNI